MAAPRLLHHAMGRRPKYECLDRDLVRVLWEMRCEADGSWRDSAKRWLRRFYFLPGLLRLAKKRRQLIKKGHTISPLASFPLGWKGELGKLKIGDETAIADSAYLSLNADVAIGSRVVIGAEVKLLTGSHDTSDPHWKDFGKPIVIKDYAWIADGAMILPGVTIGRGAVVGAGAVVRFDVPDYAIAFGNPARTYPPERPQNLDYCPIRNVPAFEAWLGSKRPLRRANSPEHSTPGPVSRHAGP